TIYGASLQVSAATGVGTGSTLNTSVSSLQVTNGTGTGGGDINITNSGGGGAHDFRYRWTVLRYFATIQQWECFHHVRQRDHGRARRPDHRDVRNDRI